MPEPASILSIPGSAPVLIAGGGPVGLTLSALLARRGVESPVIEADEGSCSGSRAICMSRRSQEMLAWAGAATGAIPRCCTSRCRRADAALCTDGQYPAVLRGAVQ